MGSAIRKFIAVASRDDAFDFAASLLKPGARLPLAIEIEIEISKMVVRKLTANPPAERNQYTDLRCDLRSWWMTTRGPASSPARNMGRSL